jgi:hypothetical protein
VVFNDEVIAELSKNYTVVHWSILTVLACTEDGVLLPYSNVPSVDMTTLVKKLKNFMNREMNKYSRYMHLELLLGSNAIEYKIGQLDRRVKEIVLTQNGYKMIDYHLSIGGIA